MVAQLSEYTWKCRIVNGVDFMVCELHLNFMVRELKNQKEKKTNKQKKLETSDYVAGNTML